MITKDIHANVFDLVSSLSKTFDMMSQEVAAHHLYVAYLAFRLGEELALSQEDKYELVIAGMLHDVGAFSLEERLDLLEFEDNSPGSHALAGYLLLKDFEPFAKVAGYIRYHHRPWRKGAGGESEFGTIPLASQILHIADRVAVQIPTQCSSIDDFAEICSNVLSEGDEVFVPDHLSALERLSKKDYVWMEIVSDSVESLLKAQVGLNAGRLSLDDLIGFARLFCKVIDFKSEFTATHSSGVAATAAALSERLGFSEDERKMLLVAAYLHDVGKLAIPSEIIEKEGPLTSREERVMRNHVYYTYKILKPVETLELITSWGGLHQERMDGSGYPFGYRADELPLGSRVMAVADVFTALTEDRPYRKGMEKDEAGEVLNEMSRNGELDPPVVSIVMGEFEFINSVRTLAQEAAMTEYQDFQRALERDVQDS